MRADGKGWGQIASRYGVKLGEVKRADKRRTRRSADRPDKPAKPSARRSPSGPRSLSGPERPLIVRTAVDSGACAGTLARPRRAGAGKPAHPRRRAALQLGRLRHAEHHDHHDARGHRALRRRAVDLQGDRAVPQRRRRYAVVPGVGNVPRQAPRSSNRVRHRRYRAVGHLRAPTSDRQHARHRPHRQGEARRPRTRAKGWEPASTT